MSNNDREETSQATKPPRRTNSLSPAKRVGAPNMKRLSHYNLLDLRLYAGGMNIVVPTDFEEGDVMKIIEQKADDKLRKSIPKFNRAALLASLSEYEPASRVEGSSSGKSKSPVTTGGQQVSYSSRESGGPSRRGGKDSGHGTTHSSATEEVEVEEIPNPKKQNKRVSFVGVPDTESEESPSASEEEQDPEQGYEPEDYLAAAKFKLNWLESLSAFFTEEITENEEELATLREQMHVAKLEAACIETEIGKVDVMTEILEVEVAKHAGPEALAKYQCAIANMEFEDEEPVQVQVAEPSVGSKEQPVVIPDTDESDDENQVPSIQVAPSVRAGPSVPQGAQEAPKAPIAVGKKRRRSYRSREDFSDDSGDEGDDERPVAKKMRFSKSSQDDDASTACSSHSAQNSGPRATNRKVAPLPQRVPKGVAASGSNRNNTSRTRTVDETASLSVRAVQSRVNKDSESVASARPKEGNRSATRAPQAPCDSDDMFAPAKSVSSGGLFKLAGSTSTAAGPSIPQLRWRSSSNSLIHSTTGRSSGTHSRQAADRATAGEVPMKTPTREVVRPKTATQVRGSGSVGGSKAGRKGFTGPQ